MAALIGFTSPLILLALLGLPLLWWVLRVLPPLPRQQRFPAVTLLQGLKDENARTETTPLWLMLLRMFLISALILAFAGPILNPDRQLTVSRPLLIVAEGGWASAQDAAIRREVSEAALAQAHDAGQPAGILQLTQPQTVRMRPAEEVKSSLAALTHSAFLPDGEADDLRDYLPDQDFDTIWLTSGLAWPGQDALYEALAARGSVTFYAPSSPVFAIGPPQRHGTGVHVPLHVLGEPVTTPMLLVEGTDPSGRPITLQRLPFEPGDGGLSAAVDLPAEQLARVRSFRLEGVLGAGGVALVGSELRRAEIGLVRAQQSGERIELLDPKHYLRVAAGQLGTVIEAPLPVLITANPDAILLDEDVQFTGQIADDLASWLRDGGVLIRFASQGLFTQTSNQPDPFLPVRLRQDARAMGGAMSWDTPRHLAAFDLNGPFAGLETDSDVTVLAQALAAPSPSVAEATIATLDDGTPLVTASSFGDGRIVFFHIGANAEWSNLPLSGLFPAMLARLARPSDVGVSQQDMGEEIWQLNEAMDGSGALLGVQDETALTTTGELLRSASVSAQMPPGLWQSGERQLIRNVLAENERLMAAQWPSEARILPLIASEEVALKPYLLALASVLLIIDLIVSSLLRGHILRLGAACVLVALGAPHQAKAQDITPPTPDESLAIASAGEVVLGHVITGDERLDQMAYEGLRGLGYVLTARTSVEPAAPQAIDLESADLSFYPLLYWPVSAEQATPSAAAYERLAHYLSSGGLIVFDTRDGDLGSANTSEARALQRLAEPLQVPALVPIPQNHVLTRSFYLLYEMPGRQRQGIVWVAAPRSAGPLGGSENDGVSPVVIGGGDWAAAWAVDEALRPLYPMGSGPAAAQQREIAHRFGVNLVMYALTGNYKSDQVHVPALLERLGQ